MSMQERMSGLVLSRLCALGKEPLWLLRLVAEGGDRPRIESSRRDMSTDHRKGLGGFPA